jgi:hypothetical protein
MRRQSVLWGLFVSRFEDALDRFRRRRLSAEEAGELLGVSGRHADLIPAGTGQQLWSDSYDLALPDIIEVHDAMAQQIAAVIEPELARIERETAMRKPPQNLDAWDCYQRGLWHLWGFNRPGFAESELMFRRAIELESGFARAHGALA